MLRAYLQKLKALIEDICPYEVRLAHSGRRLPENTPFILLDVKSVTADLSAAVSEGRVRYPVTAVISAAVYAPVSHSSEAAARILAACVMPVMAGEKTAVCGLSEGSVSCGRQTDCHILTAEFRVKGVYTIESTEKEDEV